jgi:hypothetical protein
MKTTLRHIVALTLLFGCSGEPDADPGGGGGAPGSGGRGGGGSGGMTPAGTGGQVSGSGGVSGGTGGSAAPAPDAAAVNPDGPAASDAGSVGDVPASAPGQGPVAQGTIVFSQDFENGRDGITLSPTNLPESRAAIVDDPLGQRGKVMRLQWMPGDNYRIGQYRPRANISNTGYYYAAGDKISYAWGFMTEGSYIGATIAQNITGGDPIWMLRGQANGELDIIPGGGKVPYKLEPKKWYDIRVEMNYVGGAAGLTEFYINGTLVFTKRGGLAIGPRPHWDGGIYLTSFGQSGEGNSTPRTHYISNLSVGKK